MKTKYNIEKTKIEVMNSRIVQDEIHRQIKLVNKVTDVKNLKQELVLYDQLHLKA